MKARTKNLWKELYENKEAILLLTFAWIVLFGRLSILIIASGLIISILVVLFTDHFLLDRNYGVSYSIGFGTLIKYFGRTFYEVVVSGFKALPNVLSGKADVKLVTAKTKLNSDLLINLLTNSITLTPGSLTVSKDGNELHVLTFDPPSEGEDLRAVIPLKLENILKESEEKSGNRYYSDE